MKNKTAFFKTIVPLILLINLSAHQEDFPVLTGPYLGQKPPEMTPKVFARGIISTEVSEGCSYFSKDGQLYLFARGGSVEPGIFIMEQKDGVWSKPQLASFSAGRHDWDFTLAPDESYLILCSDRPGGYGKADIYISFRKDNGSWTEPVNLGEKVNSSYDEYIPAVTPDGKYFFFTTNKTGNRDIYWVSTKIFHEFMPEYIK